MLKKGKMTGIQKEMKGRLRTQPDASKHRAERVLDPGAALPSSHKKSRRAEGVDGNRESGDMLDDNFLVENLDASNGGVALDDLDEDIDISSSIHKKRKQDELKEMKKAKARTGPKREDSATIVSASVEAKAEFFLKHFRASDTGGKMSSVETADYVASDHFHGAGLDLDSMGEQLAAMCPSFADRGMQTKVEGSVAAPYVAVLVGSSQRGAQVLLRLKEMTALTKGNSVVKAYESHSKVKKLLSKFLASDAALHTRVVVATAGRLDGGGRVRLLRLLSGGEMDSKRLQVLVIDLAPDAKQRSLMDMKEVREDVIKLHTQLLAPLLASSQLKIAFM